MAKAQVQKSRKRKTIPLTIIPWLNQKTKIEFNVEVSKTEHQIRWGLSFRETLPPGEGMLFDYEDAWVWDEEKPHDFIYVWMSDCSISLDVLFLNEKKEIVDHIENLEPLSEEVLSSRREARYMLEIPAGTISEYFLGSGGQASW